jgi:hypothetical protein
MGGAGRLWYDAGKEAVMIELYDDSEWSDDELRLQLARSAKDNGWDEAGMDAYDRYDEEWRKRCP